MKTIFKVTIATGETGYFLASDSDELNYEVEAYFCSCPSLDKTYKPEEVTIADCVSVPVSGEAVKALADQYAKAECSAWANDYYGYVQGFIAAYSLFKDDSQQIYKAI